MTAPRWTPVAAVLVLGALLSDWVVAELFLRRDTALNVAGALALNVLAVALLLAAAWRLLPTRAFAALLRVAMLLGAAALAYAVLKASGSVALPATARSTRLAVVGLVLAAALVWAWRMGDEVGERLARAIAFASLAFVLVPFGWRAVSYTPRVWLGPPAAGSTPATALLLLDELGAPAARPIAQDLRDMGLQVEETAIAAAGENTQNVVPAMFTGAAFDNPRACGRSTVCSGSRFLDLGAVRVERPDVHVTGLLFPYCDIAGLASCYPLPLPHDDGSAYRGLAAFYLRKVGIVLAPPAPAKTQRQLLDEQLAFVAASPFWNGGGVLYAHLPIPHPPGLDGATTLDADYAANIDAARTLVKATAARLRERFGAGFTLVITSDHPLRDYWCTSGTYRGEACRTRDAFRSDRVPLIVAAVDARPAAGIASNRDVFALLNRLAGGAAP